MFSIGGPRAGKCNFGGPFWGGKSLRTTALDEFVVRNRRSAYLTNGLSFVQFSSPFVKSKLLPSKRFKMQMYICSSPLSAMMRNVAASLCLFTFVCRTFRASRRGYMRVLRRK